jgi:hypothetical protein
MQQIEKAANKALLPDKFPLRSKFAAERGVRLQNKITETT